MTRSVMFVIAMILVASAAFGDSLNCRKVGACDITGGAIGVTVAGNYAYVDGDNYGLRIVDVSNPRSPWEVGHYDTPGNASDVAVVDSLAYVADNGGGLRVIDVSDPQNPHELGSCQEPNGGASAVAVAGGYAFVPYGFRVAVMDVSDPANPHVVAATDSQLVTQYEAYADNYAYVSAGDSGLRIINVSDPLHPHDVGHWLPLYAIGRVAVQGHYVYAADPLGPTRGMRIIDVSSPTAPTEVGYWPDSADFPTGIAVSGNYAYVGGEQTGLCVIDVSDPAHPQKAGYYNDRLHGENVFGITVAGGYIYMADYNQLRILQFYGGTGVQEKSVPQAATTRPEPTMVRGQLVLPGSPRSEASASVALLDISGRNVQRLHPGANDVSGCTPGVYFVRFETPSGRLTRKLMLVR